MIAHLLLFAASVAPALQPAPDPPGAPASAPAERAGPASEVSSDRLMDLIAALPERRSGSGTDEHRRGLARAQELLTGELESLGLEPALQRVEWAPPALSVEEGAEAPEWNNIIVELPGRDLASEVLIISAHYDAVPESPGADDDGTGVAAIIELARVLRDEPMRRTVRLILFTLEEEWLIGSQRYMREYARVLRKGEEELIGMVSLDGLGYFTDEPNSQESPITPRPGVFEPPTTGDFIALGGILQHRAFSGRLAEEMRSAAPELKVFVADVFPVPPPDLLRSDHAPFLLAGLPAVMLTDTANFRSPHYHRASDTIDTIDVERFTLVVRALAGAVHAIAEPFARAGGAPEDGEGG